MSRLAVTHAGVWENGRGFLPDGTVSPPGETGYGRTGTQLEYALERLGYEVEPGTPFEHQPPEDGLVAGTVLAVQLPGHLTGVWKGQRTVLTTMFECDRVPDEFSDSIHEYDTVVVPCAENKVAFDRLHDDVRVVPLGVDPARWHYTQRREITRADPFTFLAAGAGWHRKGFDIVTKAFMELRDAARTPMRLIVKSQSDLVWDQQPIDPDIVYLKESMTNADEVALYERAHCFVSASRGEGWGLCPHQAIAQGIPTILGDACGQAEFARWGIPVDTHKVNADYGIWQDTGQWWEPDYDQIVERMDAVYHDYDAALEVAKDGAAGIAHLTWDNSARHLAEIIGQPEPLTPTEWRPFERKVYPIMVTRDMRCNVGGVRYLFAPGETYYATSDVKRILFLCEVLHPDTPVDGLLADQATEFASAVETHCPTCGREFPSVLDEANETLAELAALGLVKA